MMTAMKLRIEKIDDATVLVLPDELSAKLNLKPGYWLEVSQVSGDGVRLTPCAADFNKTMAILDDVMVEYHDTLKKLAGSCSSWRVPIDASNLKR
jgi:antitoxin component of MazEF toxin-antitoxin module